MTRILALGLALSLSLSACAEDPAPAAPDPMAEGWRAAHAGDHETAAARYQAAAEASPTDAEAWTALARERLRAEQPMAALEAARRAVEADDGSADAHELLGRALIEAADGPMPDRDAEELPPETEPAPPGTARSIQRATEAAAALRRALELDPERHRVHFALARAEELASHPDQAVEAYRASAESGALPARSLAAAARTRLDALGLNAMTDELAQELEAELDRAEELAEDDEAARGAIIAQRRRLARMRTRTAGTFALDGPPEHARDAQIARDADIARAAGILGALRPGASGSPYGAESGIGSSPMNALGDLTGAGLGDGAGFGGLGLRGRSGLGGGGTSEESMALGGLGTRGGGTGSGYGRGGGQGYGRGAGRPAPTVRLGIVNTTGSLDRSVAERIVRRNLNRIRFCYERERSSAPALTGQLSIRLDVGADGRVTGTQVSSSSMPDPVDRCVESVARRLRFPEVAGGATVTVPYRFGA